MTSLSNQPTPVPPAPATTETAAAPGWAALRPLLLRMHFYAGLLIAPFLACRPDRAGLRFTPQLDEPCTSTSSSSARTIGTPGRWTEQVAAAGRPPGGHLVLGSSRGARAAPPWWCSRFRGWADMEPPSTSTRTPGRYAGADHLVRDPAATTWLDDLHRNLHLGIRAALLRAGRQLAVGPRPGRADPVAAPRRPPGPVLPPPARNTGAGRGRTRGWHGTAGWLSAACCSCPPPG